MLAKAVVRWQLSLMNDQLTPRDLRQLSVTDRLRLIEDVWDSLRQHPDTLQVPDWHRVELDARLQAHVGDPVSARPWSEVKTEILDIVRKK